MSGDPDPSNMTIPVHYKPVHHGFWIFAAKDPSAGMADVLPFASDCYLESLHFATCALAIPPAEQSLREINWYVSAHIAAYISIFDAARHDMKVRGGAIRFEATPLHKELTASSTASTPSFRDPVNANRLYRAIRNLRVHYGRSLVTLDTRPIVAEYPHWYFREVEPAQYRLLRNAPLSDDELCAFNEYLHKDTLIDVFGRMLAIIHTSLTETAAIISSGP